jgi:hypothetical protein
MKYGPASIQNFSDFPLLLSKKLQKFSDVVRGSDSCHQSTIGRNASKVEINLVSIARPCQTHPLHHVPGPEMASLRAPLLTVKFFFTYINLMQTQY